jgi:hypothetical protein
MIKLGRRLEEHEASNEDTRITVKFLPGKTRHRR